MMWCKVCGAPVFRSDRAEAWFHDVWPRWLASIAREVTDQPGAVMAARKPRPVEMARLP